MSKIHEGAFLLNITRHLFTVVPSRWKRRRLFGPRQVLVCVMHLSVLGRRTYSTLLRDLHASMQAALEWTRIPTASAFSQARQKLCGSVCKKAFHDIAACCPGGASAGIRYGAYRVLASDASKVELPSSKALRQRFGCPKTHARSTVPQALFTALWDVSRNRPVDWRLGRWRSSERDAAFSLARNLGPNDVVLGDRGTPSRRVFIEIRQRGAHFLMRVGADHHAYTEVQEFIASSRDDAVVHLRMRTASQRLANGSDSMPVRLIKHTLEDGKPAVFATSFLDQVQHPREQLIALYAKRWRIENAFRDMKLTHNLELLRSRSVRGIHQELTGIMLYMLMASEFEALARSRLGKPLIGHILGEPHQVQDCGVRLNHGMLIAAVARTMVVAVTQPNKLQALLSEELEYLWRYRSAIRPNRSYPRRAKSPNSLWRGGSPGKWAK